MTITTARFGRLPDGTDVDVYTLDNGRGLELRAITYGGIVTDLSTPDRTGRTGSVVLGHASLPPYLSNPAYLGAIVWRYANRIARGRFALDGSAHQLSINSGVHHLHGGTCGFDRRVWAAEPRRTSSGVAIRFSRTSAEREEGYPGALAVAVSYALSNDDDAVTIDYEATTTAPTVVNPTQHSYFDLSAGLAANALTHELTIDADAYVPVDDDLIPLGGIAPVHDTPFDFRQSTAIGARIMDDHEQLRHGQGYDHSWLLNGTIPATRAAAVAEPSSGRTLQIWTTEPAVQFYSGNQLDGRITAAGGRVLGRHAGFCLETQHLPDSPNRPTFPSTVLRPGQTFRSRTLWRFGTC